MDKDIMSMLSKRLKQAESEAVSNPNGLKNLMSDYDNNGAYWQLTKTKKP